MHRMHTHAACNAIPLRSPPYLLQFCGWAVTWRQRCSTCTPRASCTATSSPLTSCWMVGLAGGVGALGCCFALPSGWVHDMPCRVAVSPCHVGACAMHAHALHASGATPVFHLCVQRTDGCGWAGWASRGGLRWCSASWPRCPTGCAKCSRWAGARVPLRGRLLHVAGGMSRHDMCATGRTWHVMSWHGMIWEPLAAHCHDMAWHGTPAYDFLLSCHTMQCHEASIPCHCRYTAPAMPCHDHEVWHRDGLAWRHGMACRGRRHQCNAPPRLMGISLLLPLPLLTCRARPSISPPRPCAHPACTPQVPMPAEAAAHAETRARHAPPLFLHAMHRMRLVLSPSILLRPQWLQLLTCGRWAASCMSVPAGGRRLRHPAPSSSTRSFWKRTRSCLQVRGEGPEGAKPVGTPSLLPAAADTVCQASHAMSDARCPSCRCSVRRLQPRAGGPDCSFTGQGPHHPLHVRSMGPSARMKCQPCTA